MGGWRWGVLLALASVPAFAGDKIRVVNEGGIRDEWTLAPGAKLPVPAYPSTHAEQAEVCIAVGYLLNADGSTSDFALLKAWSAQEPKQGRDDYWGAFAGAASAALSQWHFQPRQEVEAPRPAYTVATFLFAAAAPQELRKRCAIPNLALRIIELRYDNKARRRMAGKDIFERLDIDPTLETRYREDERRRTEAIMRKAESYAPSSPPPPQPSPPSGG